MVEQTIQRQIGNIYNNKSFVTERDQCPRRRFDTEIKLQSKTNYIIVENSPVKIQVWKSTKSNNSKSITPRVMDLVHCTSPQWDLSTQESSSQYLKYFSSYAPDKFKNENEQRATTPKVYQLELWFLCTALLLNEIYLPIKFHVDALHSFKVMLRTKFKNENEQRTITPKVWQLEL